MNPKPNQARVLLLVAAFIAVIGLGSNTNASMTSSMGPTGSGPASLDGGISSGRYGSTYGSTRSSYGSTYGSTRSSYGSTGGNSSYGSTGNTGSNYPSTGNSSYSSTYGSTGSSAPPSAPSGGGTGYYVQQCTSSGKGGKSCSWVWIQTGPGPGGGPGANGHAAAPPPPPPIPETFSIAASPRLIKSGSSSTITWTSTAATSCSVTGPNVSASGISGTKVATDILQQAIFTLTCTFPSGVKKTTVTVNIIPAWQEL